MRHKKTEKRQVQEDPLYKSRLVEKFINRMMRDGKKTIAQNLLYSAFSSLKQKNEDPLQVFERALQNVGPKIEVRPRRVGGASYQIPTEIRGDRKTSLAIRWILQAAKTRSNKEYHTFSEKLAAELFEASQNQGAAIKKRDTIHRMAEANKAFAHFRW